ncbi:hypothetical protein TNCV_2641641 [Trichonephila clavipes]|nr:hypothetical protein TNCV_2641641 [Trichonephila clavipes]
MKGVLLAPCHDEFRGPRSGGIRKKQQQVSIDCKECNKIGTKQILVLLKIHRRAEGLTHVKSVKAQSSPVVLPMEVWRGKSQLRCRLRHLTVVQS